MKHKLYKNKECVLHRFNKIFSKQLDYRKSTLTIMFDALNETSQRRQT